MWSQIGSDEAGPIYYVWIERLTATVLKMLTCKAVQCKLSMTRGWQPTSEKGRRPRLTAEVTEMTAVPEKAAQPVESSSD